MISPSNGVLTVIEAADRIVISKRKQSYHCDLTGAAVKLPLPFGSGVYTVRTFRKSGNSYTPIKTMYYNAQDANDYMLKDNLYVPITPAWGMSKKLCAGKTQMAAYRTVRQWVQKNVVYDFVKAVIVPKDGALPDALTCYQRRVWICQDVASLTVGMLRAAGVPSRLVIGRADGRYHAWVEALVGGKWYRFDHRGSAKTYTKERWY